MPPMENYNFAMIVETMSYEEIAREYDKIHDSIFPRS